MAAAGRTSVRPTPFGVVVAVALAAMAVLRPGASDVAVAGMVWAAALGLLVVGTVAPLLSVRSVRPEVVSVPDHAVVGTATEVVVRLGPTRAELRWRWRGAGEVTWVAPGRPRDVRLALPVARRGEHAVLRAEVRCDAPLGVVAATRTVELVLRRPLAALPAVRHEPVVPGPLAGPGVDGAAGGPAGGGAVRSVRPYVAGDPAHLVHWPSSARTGSLVVRELDPPATTGLAVVVELSAGPADGDAPDVAAPPPPADEVDERAVERAAGAAVGVLAARGRVLLCLATATGPVAVEARDAGSVLRALAGATGGPPAVPPPGWPVRRVVAAGDAGGPVP